VVEAAKSAKINPAATVVQGIITISKGYCDDLSLRGKTGLAVNRSILVSQKVRHNAAKCGGTIHDCDLIIKL
jgi:hypothetical protein